MGYVSLSTRLTRKICPDRSMILRVQPGVWNHRVLIDAQLCAHRGSGCLGASNRHHTAAYVTAKPNGRCTMPASYAAACLLPADGDKIEYTARVSWGPLRNLDHTNLGSAMAKADLNSCLWCSTTCPCIAQMPRRGKYAQGAAKFVKSIQHCSTTTDYYKMDYTLRRFTTITSLAA